MSAELPINDLTIRTPVLPVGYFYNNNNNNNNTTVGSGQFSY